MRIIGIDYGKSKIGLALSDQTGFIASPLDCIRAESQKKALEAVSEKCLEMQAQKVVIGLPLHMSGEASELSQAAEKFGDELRKITNLEVSFFDERMSSMQADRIMLEADLSRAKRKSKIDALSAAIILQSYLDAKS